MLPITVVRSVLASRYDDTYMFILHVLCGVVLSMSGVGCALLLPIQIRSIQGRVHPPRDGRECNSLKCNLKRLGCAPWMPFMADALAESLRMAAYAPVVFFLTMMAEHIAVIRALRG